MKISYDQLTSHLQHELVPVYLVTGEETLLVEEACTLIKTAADKLGYEECIRLIVGSGFDWSLFREAYESGSLFSDRQCVVLQLASTKLSEEGKNILLQSIEKSNSHKILIVVAGKLEAAVSRNAWVKAIEKLGVWIPIWPLLAAHIAPWVMERLKRHGLEADAQGIQLLIAHTQGNLWATAQAVEKLALLYAPGCLTEAQIRQVSVDNAHYDVFDWVDILLKGNEALALRMLSAFRGEGVEPTLILWALTRELRQLLSVKRSVIRGQSMAQAMVASGVWEKRKSLFSRAVQKHSLETFYCALQLASRLDRMIKGAMKGDVWDELADLSLLIAGGNLCMHTRL